MIRRTRRNREAITEKTIAEESQTLARFEGNETTGEHTITQDYEAVYPATSQGPRCSSIATWRQQDDKGIDSGMGQRIAHCAL